MKSYFSQLVVFFAVFYSACGDAHGSDQIKSTAPLIQSSSTLAVNPTVMIAGEPFVPEDAVYAAYGLQTLAANLNSAAQPGPGEAYRFMVILSDYNQLEDRILLSDYAPGRMLVFDLFAGLQTNVWPHVGVGAPFVYGRYNLSAHAQKDSKSRWGTAKLRRFSAHCRYTDQVTVVGGVLDVQLQPLSKLWPLGTAKASYRLALSDGAIVHGEASLRSIAWPSHVQSGDDLHCFNDD